MTKKDWLGQVFLQFFAGLVSDLVMHLNMDEHEPQNKQNGFEGFIRGLISRTSYQKCSGTERGGLGMNPVS